MALGAGAFLLSGAAQAVSGFGSAVVAIPILTLVTDAVTAVVAATTMSLGLAGWAAVRERAHADRTMATHMIVAGLLGIPAGLLLLLGLGDDELQILVAVTVVVTLLVIVTGLRLPPGRVTALSTGVVSGALLGSTGMNGPPLVVGLHSSGLKPHAFRATLQAVFVGQGFVVVMAFLATGLITGEVLTYAAVGLLAGPLGWIVGDRIFTRVAEAFRWVLVFGLLASALVLVVTATMH